MLTAKSIRLEPFLWIHLSGIVLFPVLLQITWLSLSLGEGYPYVLELLSLGIGGIVPVLLMQLTRPFNIFSILFVALKAESLTSEQRQILALFKTIKHRFFSLVAAGIMAAVLLLIYRLSPLATGLTSLLPFSFLPQWHLLGMAIAILAFAASNLFLQVPLSVLLVLLTQQSKLPSLESCSTEKTDQEFTTPGIKVNKILWFLEKIPKVNDPA